MLKYLQTLVCVIFLSGGLAAHASETNWPGWRGPGFSGSIEAGHYPVEWSSTDNLAWKYELPGRGFSTPIVWGERIIVTAPVDGKDSVLSLDLSGKLQWQVALTPERSGKHRNASGCNPSPVTDGELIVAYYKSGTLAALDFSGKVRWTKNLQEVFGKDQLYWDIGTSPVLTEKYVIGTVMHSGKSGMIAYEKETGKEAWQIARQYETPTENSDSYTTPLVMKRAGQEIILVWGADHVTAHRATNGELLWSSAGFNPNQTQNWPSVGSPVVMGDIVVINYGRGAHVAGIRLGGSGDVTKTNRLWTHDEIGAFVPTPAVYDGRIYVLTDKGTINCIDPNSGDIQWSEDLPKHRAKYYSSPTIAGGKLYAAREDGVVFVAQISGGFKILSENPMAEKMIASPVPVAGQLLLRGEQHLFSVKTP
jgi:outer membrane protein assembly factor BamB